MQVISKLNHSVYCLNYHLVIATKFRNKCLTSEMISRFRELASDATERWGGGLMEVNGELDHVHLLFTLPPTVALSDFVNNLKTTTARLLCKEYSLHLEKYFWKHKGLWSRS